MKHSSLIQAMLLVGGTCIGGGMIALPVATGVSGFFPSLVMMLLCYLVMTASGLLLIEASLWFEEGTHMSSMSEKLLGLPGKVLCWLLYLFIAYASIVAYTAEGGFQMAHFLHSAMDITLSKGAACLLFILLFGFIVDFGAERVGRINAMLFFGMMGAYFLMVVLGVPEVNLENLRFRDWTTAHLGLPLLLTSFSYQAMAPSLTPYLKKNVKWLRWSVVGGTTIALVTYVIWQFLILGIVPAEGEQGLKAALERGEAATHYIRHAVEGTWIVIVAEFFTFFAVVTSFLGMTLGLFDFLADGLQIKKRGLGKLFLALLIVLPTVYFATFFERIFLIALDLSGGFGDTILNGLLPVAMVWSGRYFFNYPAIMLKWGGKPLLVLIFLLFFGALAVETKLIFGF